MKISATFNGSSNFLSVANFTGNPAAFSVSCWLNLSQFQNTRTYFSNFQSTGSKGWVTGISDVSGNKVKFYLGSNILTSATALTTSVWAHVVCTYDGTTAKIYLNGNTTPDATLVSAVVYGSAPTNNYIGAEPSVSQFIAGSLAGLGYWSKALSTTEVTSLWNNGNGLLFADLSGSLLTSLGAYYDFNDSGNLGLDSSAGAHNMINTLAVLFNPSGPSGSIYSQPSPFRVPSRLALQSGWATKLIAAIVPGQESGNVVGARDYLSQSLLPYQTSAMTRAAGPWGPELNNTLAGSGGAKFGVALQGSSQFTLSSLCLCDAYQDRSLLWGGETNIGADMRVGMTGTAGLLSFQVNGDGVYTNLTVTMPLNTYIFVTCRLAPSGVRSIWFGPYKVAERTDAGITYGSGTETNGSGWGGSPQNTGRGWSGRLTAGYVWNRALSDAEIVVLAGDPFAPVRPVGPRSWFTSLPLPVGPPPIGQMTGVF